MTSQMNLPPYALFDLGRSGASQSRHFQQHPQTPEIQTKQITDTCARTTLIGRQALVGSQYKKYLSIQEIFSSKGPVVHAQAVYKHQKFLRFLHGLLEGQEIILEDLPAAQKCQLSVLLQTKLLSRLAMEKWIILQCGEDFFLETECNIHCITYTEVQDLI